jgi:hypothetical protein
VAPLCRRILSTAVSSCGALLVLNLSDSSVPLGLAGMKRSRRRTETLLGRRWSSLAYEMGYNGAGKAGRERGVLTGSVVALLRKLDGAWVEGDEMSKAAVALAREFPWSLFANGSSGSDWLPSCWLLSSDANGHSFSLAVPFGAEDGGEAEP